MEPGETPSKSQFTATEPHQNRKIHQFNNDQYCTDICRYENFHHVIAGIGTTAEIYSVKNEMDEASGISTITVLAQGRQRFELKDYKRTITG